MKSPDKESAMTSIERIKRKFLDQNPVRQEQFAVPPDWVVAVAAVMDEQEREIAKLKTRIRPRHE